MLRVSSTAYWGLGIVFHIVVTVADLGPLFRSTSYEHAGHGKWPHQSYHSSDIAGPMINVRRFESGCDSGQYILLSPMGSQVRSAGPMIVDEYGNLVWTSPYGDNWGLDVQMMHDEPYLTFCAWRGKGSHVTCYMLDAAYEERFSIRPKNAWGADGTEFQITPQNTAVLTTSMYITYDLTPVNGPRHGRMRDVGFQEIDMETGALLFEWRWSDHWNITDVIQWPSGTEGSPETPWDPFHINSVHKDSAGNYLVSSRHTSTVGYINGQSGEFLWKLGGKQNMFEDLSGGTATSISMQHHARFLNGNSTITVFNNGVVPGRSDYQSKGMIIDLDLQAMTAKVRQEYLSPHNMGSNSRGSMQVLDSQNHVLLGFGINAGWAEYSIKGDLHCDVHYGPEAGFGTEEVLSYRVLKRSWIGRPKQPPDMVQKGSDVYISWNGATEVTIWTLLAADANISDHVALASVHNEGFETRIPLPANLTTASVRAVGLDRHGNTLGFTSTLDLGEAVEHVFQAPLVVHY